MSQNALLTLHGLVIGEAGDLWEEGPGLVLRDAGGGVVVRIVGLSREVVGTLCMHLYGPFLDLVLRDPAVAQDALPVEGFPTCPGDYAVVCDGEVFFGRLYTPMGDGGPEPMRFRERHIASPEWQDEVEGDHPFDAYTGPWARFPDGTFGQGWE